jgi:protein-S-isoprenylcysteine O-methyltransferase Ste14
VTVRTILQRAIRPSTTTRTTALWAKSLLNAVLFFCVFMMALPWLAHHLLPLRLPLPHVVRTWLAGVMALVGIGAWGACLDTFSRYGRGTPLPADAPRNLVTRGLFGRMRNPIMAGELLVIWAIALFLATLGPALYAVGISLGAHWMVRQIEEPELHRRFGRAYEEYCRDTPRWLPRIRRRRDRAASGSAAQQGAAADEPQHAVATAWYR